jgi:hypothetical protein
VGRPRKNACIHPRGEACRNCHRARTRRWRDAHAEVRERARDYAKTTRKTDPWANAKAYIATYIKRWDIPHERCAACNAPRAIAFPPDPTEPQAYFWLCRGCIAIKADVIPQMQAEGRLQRLRRPEQTQREALVRVPNGTAGKDPLTLGTPTTAVPGRVAAARVQLAIGARHNPVNITTLATYYLALLDEEEELIIDRIGMTVDLARWRPYGIDDLDLSIINLFYRRRQREAARSRFMAAQ